MITKQDGVQLGMWVKEVLHFDCFMFILKSFSNANSGCTTGNKFSDKVQTHVIQFCNVPAWIIPLRTKVSKYFIVEKNII